MKKLTIKKTPKKKPFSPKFMFYTFLFMSVVVIWLGAYTTNTHTEKIIDAPVSKEESNTKSIPPTKPYIDEKTVEEQTLIKEIDETYKNTVEDNSSSLPSPDKDEKQMITYIALPINGEIIKPYSDTDLIYSKTMADYRTHNGIDIKSNIGDEVYSPQNGKVKEISKDDYLGYTITIDHGNMISKISNLSSKINLKAGEKVNMGQMIGICGDSADYEIADEAHIHYELIVNGVNVNPLEYIE